MLELPSFPSGGPLRALAMAGTVALAAFSVSAAVQAARKAWPGLAWALAPLVLGATSILLGRLSGAAHAVASVLTLAAALRNVACFRGSARWAAAVGALGWAVALLAARALFG